MHIVWRDTSTAYIRETWCVVDTSKHVSERCDRLEKIITQQGPSGIGFRGMLLADRPHGELRGCLALARWHAMSNQQSAYIKQMVGANARRIHRSDTARRTLHGHS